MTGKFLFATMSSRGLARGFFLSSYLLTKTSRNRLVDHGLAHVWTLSKVFFSLSESELSRLGEKHLRNETGEGLPQHQNGR